MKLRVDEIKKRADQIIPRLATKQVGKNTIFAYNVQYDEGWKPEWLLQNCLVVIGFLGLTNFTVDERPDFWLIKAQRGTLRRLVDDSFLWIFVRKDRSVAAITEYSGGWGVSLFDVSHFKSLVALLFGALEQFGQWQELPADIELPDLS